MRVGSPRTRESLLRDARLFHTTGWPARPCGFGGDRCGSEGGGGGDRAAVAGGDGVNRCNDTGRRRLKYAATINDDVLNEDTDDDYELQYIDIGNVYASGSVEEPVTYKFKNAPSRARRRVRDGDIIISCVRTYLQAIAQIQDPPTNLVVSTGFAVIRPSEGALNARFANYALQEPSFLAEIEKRSVGVSYPAINASDLAGISVHLPPIPLQRAVADYLDRETTRLDALMVEKERVLTLLEEKRVALITSAVTRGLDTHVSLRDSTIPSVEEIPEHWRTTRLRHVTTDVEQGWSPEAANYQPKLDEWGVLKLNAVNRSRFDETAAKTLPADLVPRPDFEIRRGDVLVTRSNTPALVGDACFVETTRPKLMLSDIIYRLTVDSQMVDGKFLVYFLTIPTGRIQIEHDARGTCASMVKISRDHIKNWHIPVPPLYEQRAIVDHLDRETAQIDGLVAQIRETIALLKERRSSLIAAAVTGQIDVERTA